MRLQLPWLPTDPAAPFPDPRTALREPDGLLAVGGDLTPGRLLNAYRRGIFPWYSQGQPILWWSPDPRMIFRSDGVRLSRRFRRDLRKLSVRGEPVEPWTIRADTAFDRVMLYCAHSARHGQSGTWITPEMCSAYGELHRLGHAHSIEVREGEQLVGGLYGVAIGRMFFAESMFSAVTGGSKVALAALAAILREWGWPLFDAQVESPHLLRMGAQSCSREEFLTIVELQTALESEPASWSQAVGERDLGWLASARQDLV